MTDPIPHGPERVPDEPLSAEVGGGTVSDDAQQVRHEVGETLSLTADQQKLARLRKEGEISPHDFDLNFIYQLNDCDPDDEGFTPPLTRSDVGNQAVVLTRDDLEYLRYLRYVSASGEIIVNEPDDMRDPVLILFPDELGDLPKK